VRGTGPSVTPVPVPWPLPVVGPQLGTTVGDRGVTPDATKPSALSRVARVELGSNPGGPTYY
jgi:hypothetical protein